MESTASEKHLHEHSDEEPAEERQITGRTEQEHNTQVDANKQVINDINTVTTIQIWIGRMT